MLLIGLWCGGWLGFYAFLAKDAYWPQHKHSWEPWQDTFPTVRDSKYQFRYCQSCNKKQVK